MKSKKYKITLILTIISISIVTLFYLYFIQEKTGEELCYLEYSSPVSFYGSGLIVLFNPNDVDIEILSINFIYPSGRKVYIMNKIIRKNDTVNQDLPFFNATTDKILFSWCCKGKCYETEFNESEAIYFETRELEVELNNVTEKVETDTGKEKYPVHPVPSDCEKLSTGVYDFCYFDVAEINNNITFCEKIINLSVKTFCYAVLELNEEKCKYVLDLGLKEECLRSIKRKKGWMGLD